MQIEHHRDLSLNLCTFFLKSIGLWAAKNAVEERTRKMMLLYTIFCTSMAAIIEGRELYFNWIYDGDILYILTNFLSLLTALSKVCIILLHKAEFIDLIVYMQDKFWKTNYDLNEQRVFDNCKRICVFFVSSVTTIGMCVMLSYVVMPFIAQFKNETERILPFNVWLNIPVSKSPYYEILFTLEVIFLYQIGLLYFSFDNMFCILAIHLAGQFRILQYRFTNLCEMEGTLGKQKSESTSMDHTNRCYEKFKRYIRQHQALIKFHGSLENVYTMITLFQVLIFSVLICLFGYQILLADGPSARRTIFILLIIGAMVLLFMFTYSCDAVMEESDEVAFGAYSALWTIMAMNKPGKMLRSDLIMVIVRSRRVCCLTANGFFPVSLETYTSIWSTALSYFTLLRNGI